FGIVAALFFGIKCAVLAIVLDAVRRIGKRALKSRALVAVAALAFIAIFVFGVPFPLVILAAGLAGFLGRGGFKPAAAHGAGRQGRALIDAQFAGSVPEHVRPSERRLAIILLVGTGLWLGPLVMLLALFGPANVFTAIAAFNSKMAVVTFGGAYAALAYMAQQAVEHFHWLKPGEMLVGLGFAETTPGPLISVVQFVGFMAAYRAPGALGPIWAGTLGGLLAMWATFVPSFLWIFAGGPYVEALIGNKALNAALSAITAAVVGVILNLAIWFALNTLFDQTVAWTGLGLALKLPVLQSINLPALVIALGAMIAIFRFRLGMLTILAASCLAGVLFYYGLRA
ncbi:MAG: chromate transporter, partial [Bradyrhizobium sp.]|nr:chromate transporter [Bradyrhizobium sp.]